MMVITEEGRNEEQVWIETARQGNLESFNRLVLKYQDALYNQAYWLLRDPDWAADLVQDALIQAYRNLGSFHGGAFRAWLMRILTNAGLDELRRRKRHPSLPLEPVDAEGEELESPQWMAAPGLSVEEQIEQSELQQVIQQSIQTLPQEFRLAIVLVDLLGYEYEEAAQALNVPVGTVKSRLARGRGRLRKQLSSSETLGWIEILARQELYLRHSLS